MTFTIFLFCALKIKKNNKTSVVFDALVSLLLIQASVANEIDTTIIPNAVTYSSNLSLYNETFDFMNESDIEINVVYSRNESVTNTSNTDEATELESTLSVTEDSFRSQTQENFLFLTPDEDICNCDLTSDVCDINCCCDSDCDEEDIQVFSRCTHQVLIPDENYCYQRNIVLKNNTIYKMIQDPKSSMFCIVHDNLKYHLRYKDMPVLRSHIDLTSILQYKYKNTYFWKFESSDKFYSSEIKAGNPVFIDISDKNISKHWTLPTSCFSDMCSCNENIFYLTDFKSSCSYAIDLSRDCETDKTLSGKDFVNFCISPQNAAAYATNNIVDLIIHSKKTPVDDSDEYNSENESDLCVNVNIVKPKREANICRNVVTGIHFTVEHDGINGINKIRAQYEYADLNSNTKIITQQYHVHFIWNNISNAEKKSGNPGYQVGLPILVSVNASDPSLNENLVERGHLSTFSQDINSHCSVNRAPIKFGKNLNHGCFLHNSFTQCKMLHDKISDIFLGPTKRDIFVGVFGNANISNTNDWIEVYFEGPSIIENSDCFVSLSVRIDIVYAAVGSTANPQYKIVGVNYKYMKPEYVDLSCSPTCGNIPLTTAVSFFDVTLPAVYNYAKVPSIKANLPNDFFYPFLYGHSGRNVSKMYFIFLLFIFIWSAS